MCFIIYEDCMKKADVISKLVGNTISKFSFSRNNFAALCRSLYNIDAITHWGIMTYLVGLRDFTLN